jgi:hypothetical protein
LEAVDEGGYGSKSRCRFMQRIKDRRIETGGVVELCAETGEESSLVVNSWRQPESE